MREHVFKEKFLVLIVIIFKTGLIRKYFKRIIGKTLKTHNFFTKIVIQKMYEVCDQFF